MHSFVGWFADAILAFWRLVDRRATSRMLPAILIACVLGVAAIVHLHDRIQEISGRSAHVELATSSVRGIAEAAEMRLALEAWLRAPDEAKRETAQLKLDVFISRTRGLRSGVHGLLLENSVDVRNAHARLETLFSDIDRILAGDAAAPAAGEIEDRMLEIADLLQHITSEALIYRSKLVMRDQEAMSAYSRLQVLIVGGLLLAIGSALGLSLLQKHRLAVTHLQSQAMSDRYEYLAKHDAMTGLCNRGDGREQVVALIARAAAQSAHVAMLCLDIDRFKQINDTLGHGAGDTLIIAFAERLAQIVPPGRDSTLIRLGGDEFVVAMLHSGAPEAIEARVAGIAAHLTHVYDLEGHHVAVGASIGLAFAPGARADWATLLSQADIALRHAKERGRGQVACYEDGMFEFEQRRHQLEQDLRFALTRGQFELHYQPIIQLASGAVVAVEALLRWRHPAHGYVSPADFIPVAEDSGEIVAIGEWVLRTACRDALSMPGGISVSVNLSAVQLLRDNMVQVVGAALDSAGLGGDRLELEVTESVMIRNEQRVGRFIDAVGQLGVGVALDDFGTGYSSLGYLRRFGFRRLKIDRSFVQDIERDPQARALAHCVIDIGKALDMAVTAEGVETQAQALVLTSEGCHCVQGFMFSKPLPLAGLLAWLDDRGEALRRAG